MSMETILNSRGSIRAMKTFFQKHQRLHIWLLTDLSLLAVFCLVRENRTWMNALAKHVAGPLRQAVGRLCCRLAERAERVERIFCGLPMVLKGEGPWN